MNNCNKINLELFSQSHYTYINQIFGDKTIREIIKEMYAPRDWDFVVEDATEEFEYSKHHTLEKKGKNGEIIKWCSVDEGLQNTNINKNDSLCQSYTLLKYLNKPIEKNMKNRQMEMIKMYKNIIKRDFFKDELRGMVEIMKRKIKNTKRKDHPALWKDYTYDKPEPYLNKDYNAIYAEIQSVLDKWEKYGYKHFIKDGTCPVKK
jgi:hypothetical protein